MPRQFECFWGAGYRGNGDKSILAYHDESFFTEDRGYEPEDIENIKNLWNGESYDLPSVFGEHWVRRMKDA
jgi:hypothetical protein